MIAAENVSLNDSLRNLSGYRPPQRELTGPRKEKGFADIVREKIGRAENPPKQTTPKQTDRTDARPVEKKPEGTSSEGGMKVEQNAEKAVKTDREEMRETAKTEVDNEDVQAENILFMGQTIHIPQAENFNPEGIEELEEKMLLLTEDEITELFQSLPQEQKKVSAESLKEILQDLAPEERAAFMAKLEEMVAKKTGSEAVNKIVIEDAPQLADVRQVETAETNPEAHSDAEGSETKARTDKSDKQAQPLSILAEDGKRVFALREMEQPMQVQNEEAIVKIQDLQEFILKEADSKIRLSQGEGLAKLQMQLEPRDLGKLTLRFVSENGQVSLKIFAESSTTKALVEQNLITLKENFEEQGIKCAEIEVEIGRGGEFRDFAQEGRQPFERGQTRSGRRLNGTARKRGIEAIAGQIRTEDKGLSRIRLSRMEFLA